MCIHLLTLVGSQVIEQPIESVGRERRVNLCRAIMFTERFLNNVLEFLARRSRPNDKAS